MNGFSIRTRLLVFSLTLTVLPVAILTWSATTNTGRAVEAALRAMEAPLGASGVEAAARSLAAHL